MTDSSGPAAAPTDLQFFPAVATHLLRSEYVRQTFRVQVMVPLQRRNEQTRFPVIYCTDGNLLFETLRGISISLQLSEAVAPRFILVGIGYPSDCPLAGALLRGRDLMFEGYPSIALSPVPIEGVLQAQSGTQDLYAAADFLKFLATELVPFIDGAYPTLPDDRGYFGHSAGAAFGFFSLFKRPGLFKRYILSSAGCGFHGESSGGDIYENHDIILPLAREFVTTKPELDDVTLYMSAGSAEDEEQNPTKWQFVSGFHRLVVFLKAAALPGLRLVPDIVPDERHMSVWPIAFIRGIQAVFETRLREAHDR